MTNLRSLACLLCCLLLSLLLLLNASAQPTNYQNPIIPGDWSDPGIVRVGSTYYTMRSTFGWKPGIQIMESLDLINWRYAGNISLANIPAIRDGTSEGGIRGSDIGYNPNTSKFLVYAPIRETGRIVAWQADAVAGPWDGPYDITHGYDPGFFADDVVDPATGQRRLYLVKTGAALLELAPNGLSVRETFSPISPKGSEGPAITKRGGYYYFIASDGGTRPGQGHDIYTYRTTNIRSGPWTADAANPQMQANAGTNARLQGPGHATLIQDDSGNWFVVYHAFEITHYSLGRQTCMDPVEWTSDGWWRPVHGRIPVNQAPRPSLPWTSSYQTATSDEFSYTNNSSLGPQWFFNANPVYDGTAWSFTDRPGWLRIKTISGDLNTNQDDSAQSDARYRLYPNAKNTFLQRVVHKKYEVVTKVDFNAYSDKEMAGLVFYHDPRANFWFTTSAFNGQKYFRIGKYWRGTRTDVWKAANPHGNTVWLKITIDGEETARFAYSSDGSSWTDTGQSIYFGDSVRDLRSGTGGNPDLGWVADNLAAGDPGSEFLWNGSGTRNRWTATCIGVFATREAATASKNADFDFFRVTSQPYINHPRPVTNQIMTAPQFNGTLGAAFQLDLTVNGGRASHTWSASGLPAGLSINSTTGRISGTFSSSGNSTATATVTDADGRTHSRTLSFSVSGTAPDTSPTITTTSLPAAIQNSAYSQTLQLTSGNSPFTWSVSAGTLPSGLSLSTGGVLSGTPTATGTSNFTVRVVDTDGDADTQDLSLTVNAFGSGSEKIWIEAESGTRGSLWNTTADGTASGGSFITIQPGNNSTTTAPGATGQATYSFTVATAGTFKIWGRVIAPSGNDDSFWVKVDSGAWIPWNNIARSTAWTWDEVHNSNAGDTLMTYNLSAGSHTLTIAYREDGAKIDRILVTSDAAYTPSGPGEPIGGGSTYQEASGQVTMEAERATLTVNSDPSGANWSVVTSGQTGWQGTGYLAAPGVSGTNGSWTAAADAAFSVNFSTPGTYNVWVRRYATSAGDNSVFAGLGTTAINTAGSDNLSTGYNAWTWVNLGTLTVSSTGTQTVRLRRREKGYDVDRIVLTTSATAPSGTGPSESPRL